MNNRAGCIDKKNLFLNAIQIYKPSFIIYSNGNLHGASNLLTAGPIFL
jgi:hypothetical protein